MWGTPISVLEGWPAASGSFSRHPQVHIRQGNDCYTTEGVVD
jgi:hypothetical protein